PRLRRERRERGLEVPAEGAPVRQECDGPHAGSSETGAVERLGSDALESAHGDGFGGRWRSYRLSARERDRPAPASSTPRSVQNAVISQPGVRSNRRGSGPGRGRDPVHFDRPVTTTNGTAACRAARASRRVPTLCTTLPSWKTESAP